MVVAVAVVGSAAVAEMVVAAAWSLNVTRLMSAPSFCLTTSVSECLPNIPAAGGDGGWTGPCSRQAMGGIGGNGWGAGAGSGAGGSEGGGCTGAGGEGAEGCLAIDVVFFSTPVYKVTLENNDNFRWLSDVLADGTQILEVDRDNNQLIVYNQVDPTPGATYTSLVYSGTGIVSSVDLAQRTISLSESNNHWGTGSHVTGVDRTAAASSAWLSFDLNGENMQLTNSKPAPMLMANTVDPTITFRRYSAMAKRRIT